MEPMNSEFRIREAGGAAEMSPQIDDSMGDWRIFFSFRKPSVLQLGGADWFGLGGLDTRIKPITIAAALGSDTAERPCQCQARAARRLS